MNSELKKETIGFYNSNYEFWLRNSRLSIRKEYLSILGKTENKRILDVGCGTGIDAKLLSDRGAIGKGVDFSSGSIELAKSRKISGWDFEVFDSELYFDTVGYDIVLSSMELMYHFKLNKTISNYSKLLKTGGILLIVTNNPYLVSQKYGLRYDANCKYEHIFNGIPETSLKCYRSLEDIMKVSFKCNFKLINYKELYCKYADCKGFEQNNPNYFPDFICLLFEKYE
jgi:SAM-dependent methyltransferase